MLTSGCNTWDPFPVAYVACVIKKLIPAKYFVHHILQNLIKERHLDIQDFPMYRSYSEFLMQGSYLVKPLSLVLSYSQFDSMIYSMTLFPFLFTIAQKAINVISMVVNMLAFSHCKAK